jgi:SAM-dependent methyltransferase
MHPAIFQEFELICRDLAIRGDVIELGASPEHQTLLTLPSLTGAARRVGVGLDGEAEGDGYVIRRLDCHDLSAFPDGAFQLVLSNSMLEHDGHFWLSLAEAKRIAAPGGYIVLGVPGFAGMGDVPGRKLLKLISRVPFVGGSRQAVSAALDASSLTLGIHNFPGDYYRFSEQAMREILLEGMEGVSTRLVLSPPRVIGVGRKPAAVVSPDSRL